MQTITQAKVLVLENAAAVSDVGDRTEEHEDGVGQAVITYILAKGPTTVARDAM